MERVSFEVAKAIKKAGYPQILEEGYDEGYAITKVTYEKYDRFDETWFSYTAQPGTDLIFNNKYHYPEDCGEFCVAPTYLDVWLWLWGEKGIYIDIDATIRNGASASINLNNSGKVDIYIDSNDPEEAIIAAVKHIVEHNIINP